MIRGHPGKYSRIPYPFFQLPVIHPLQLRAGYALPLLLGNTELPCYGESRVHMIPCYHHGSYRRPFKCFNSSFCLVPRRINHSKENKIFLCRLRHPLRHGSGQNTQGPSRHRLYGLLDFLSVPAFEGLHFSILHNRGAAFQDLVRSAFCIRDI